jgi:hypothetical protein
MSSGQQDSGQQDSGQWLVASKTVATDLTDH